MDDQQVIADQARQIAGQAEQIRDMKRGCDTIRSRLYRIGGPLNDNVDGFTNKQLGIFFDISQDLPE